MALGALALRPSTRRHSTLSALRLHPKRLPPLRALACRARLAEYPGRSAVSQVDRPSQSLRRSDAQAVEQPLGAPVIPEVVEANACSGPLLGHRVAAGDDVAER